MIDLKKLRDAANAEISMPAGYVLELLDRLEAAEKDAARLDYLVSSRAEVCNDETCADGYWLVFNKPDGSRWVQVGEFETPREAIDAAMQS